MSRLAGMVAVAVAWGASPVAWACAVCQDPEEASNTTFGLSTAFLTFLPLLAMGALGWWGWRRFQALEAADLAAVLPLEPLD